MSEKSGVLSDHKRQRKKLIAPFNYLIGGISDISWIKQIVPELLWIALLQYSVGHGDGVRIITFVGRTARKFCTDAGDRTFASASSFAQLDDSQRHLLLNELREADYLEVIRKSLLPIAANYPSDPLRFLHEASSLVERHDLLITIKETLQSLFDRSARDPTLVQATAVWLQFDSGMLQVAGHLALAKFPRIEEYPTTELSKQIASGIRSTLNVTFGHELQSNHQWSKAFWTRGLALEKCEFGND